MCIVPYAIHTTSVVDSLILWLSLAFECVKINELHGFFLYCDACCALFLSHARLFKWCYSTRNSTWEYKWILSINSVERIFQFFGCCFLLMIKMLLRSNNAIMTAATAKQIRFEGNRVKSVTSRCNGQNQLPQRVEVNRYYSHAFPLAEWMEFLKWTQINTFTLLARIFCWINSFCLMHSIKLIPFDDSPPHNFYARSTSSHRANTKWSVCVWVFFGRCENSLCYTLAFLLNIILADRFIEPKTVSKNKTKIGKPVKIG